MTCTPTASTCGTGTGTTSAAAAAAPTSATSTGTAVANTVVGFTAVTYTPIPYVSAINAPGTIFVIILGILLFVGGTVIGAYMWYSRKHQKPVKIDDEFEEFQGRATNLQLIT
ncbi:hypothetical protein HDU82_000299 [Entophlyctis luteolus]|nr:hypothetical protein HDU82_000299 [Entophlyctis luteolus]